MGNPLKPIFENKSSGTTANCKTLSWQTESQSPIIDYKFKFRKVPSGNENFRKSASFIWNQLTIPADQSPGPFHTKSYKLDALAPSTVYEVIIQARNQFGPSEDSNILRFATPSEGKNNGKLKRNHKKRNVNVRRFFFHDKNRHEKFNFQFPLRFLIAVDIINSSSTDSNEYDIRYDEDLLQGNEIYPSPYNAGMQLTITRFSFVFVIVTFFLL